MKNFALVMFLAALATSPALAKNSKPMNRHGGQSNAVEVERGARAQAFPSSSLNATDNDVYVNGMYVGTDPDQNIRAGLRREPRPSDY